MGKPKTGQTKSRAREWQGKATGSLMEGQYGDSSLRRYSRKIWFRSYLIHVLILQYAALLCVALCALCFVVILCTSATMLPPFVCCAGRR